MLQNGYLTFVNILYSYTEATDMEANPLAKYYLVFINPCSGKGQSEKMFKEEILPLFDVAGISYNTVVTGTYIFTFLPYFTLNESDETVRQ